LFGHERGAFTGAVKRRDGRFRAAHTGTLMLDEIAEMSLPAQAKLLRVLQEGTIEPLGTNESVRVDVRVISATHRDLKERIATGLFREDLYYRINVLNIDIPPLRDRKGDLPLLVQYFLKEFARPGKATPTLSPAAWSALSAFPFPGNVRQLSHAIEHAVVLSVEGEIDLRHLPRDIVGTPRPVRARWGPRSRSSNATTCSARWPRRRVSARWPPRSWASLARICGRSCACTASPATETGPNRSCARDYSCGATSGVMWLSGLTSNDGAPLGSDIGLRVSRSPNTPSIITITKITDTMKTSRLEPCASDRCMKNNTTSVALMVAIAIAMGRFAAPRSILPVHTVSPVKSIRMNQITK
jgi:hypothetical protein